MNDDREKQDQQTEPDLEEAPEPVAQDQPETDQPAAEQRADTAAKDSPESPISIKLEIYEGPLDLLVHLVKKNEYDIFDIPISEITEQYIQYIDLIRSLNLDLAGEFLVMAATLMKIKSRMLLPVSDDEQELEEDDPRALLAQQLAEYLRYKDVADELSAVEQLDRDLFARKFMYDDLARESEREGALEVSIFDLIDAFGKMIADRKIDNIHTVFAERVSVSQRINEVIELLQKKQSMTFTELFATDKTKIDIIISFLALLEVVRLSLVTAYQEKRFGEIMIKLCQESQVTPEEIFADKVEPVANDKPEEK